MAAAAPQLSIALVDAARAKVPGGLWAACSHREQLFVAAILAQEKPHFTKAALAAGCPARSAKQMGAQIAKRPQVKAALAAAQAERIERLQVDADEVLRRVHAIAFADANALVSYRRGCCRFCHGTGHRFQRTPNELAKAQREYEDAPARSRGPNPAEEGGTGYDRRKPPHPDCPECFGEGVGSVFIADTRRVTGPAAVLYAGMKETEKGIEVKLRDQDAALTNLMRHLGLFEEKPAPPESADAEAARIRAQLDAMDATVPAVDAAEVVP